MFFYTCLVLCKAIYEDNVSFDIRINKNIVKEAKNTLKLLKPVVTSKCFSKIRINIDQPCKMASLAKKCSYEKCVVPRNLEDEVKNYACRLGQKYKNKCVYKYIDDPDAINVDLLKSRQINSGYIDGAAKIWEMMHKTVKEHTTFAKLLSGLHFSVTVHISQFFYEKKPITYNPIFYHSKRKNTYVKNLLYTYEYVKQAFEKINRKLITCSIENNNGDTEILKNLINKHKKFSKVKYDNLPYKQAKLYFDKLLNCTNCIDCDKCKLWGKIQIKGLFSAYMLHNGIYESNGMPGQDLIYFVNTYDKLTESIIYANELDKIKYAYLYLFYIYSIEILSFVVTLLLFFTFCKQKKNKKCK